MAWCEANAVDYIFGLPGNAVLNRLLEEAADDVRVRRAEAQAPVLRRYAEVRYGAKSWGRQRRVSARIEASTMGLDIRCVVTNLETGTAEWLYDTLYCARAQAENLIKLHKQHLQLGPAIAASARRLLGADHLAAGRLEGCALDAEILVKGGYAGVAIERHAEEQSVLLGPRPAHASVSKIRTQPI